MTAQETIDYYANLLILQYLGKPKAFATIQAVVTPVVMPQGSDTSLPSLPMAVQNAYNLNPTVQGLYLSAVPASGSFTITYTGSTSTAVQWDATTAEIQQQFSAFFGPGEVTVSGDLGSQAIVVSFDINTVPQVITAMSSLLDGSGSAVTISVVTNQAVGVQLDVLGKYANVVRSGFGPTGPILLSDDDFRKLIQMAIITNSAGSSLATIVDLLFRYFPNEIHVIDNANTAPMTMTYVISDAFFGSGLLDLFISEHLLPKPMGVGIAAIVPPSSLIFGYCDYRTATPTQPNTSAVPYNCGSSYTTGDFNSTWLYMDYRYSIIT